MYCRVCIDTVYALVSLILSSHPSSTYWLCMLAVLVYYANPYVMWLATYVVLAR